MATRKTSAKAPKNVEEGIEMILATEPLKTIDEGAAYVGVSGFILQGLFSEALNLPQALTWETIPTEHEHLLNEFKAKIQDTQAQPVPTEAAQLPQLPETSAPLIETQEPKAKGGEMTSGKQNSSKMTQKAQRAIDKELKTAQSIEYGIDKSEEIVNLQNEFSKGAHEQKKRELAKLNGRLKVREAAHKSTLLKIKKEVAERSEEDIALSLQIAGIQPAEELLQDIKQFSELALGKFQTVFEETIANPWETGLDNDSTDLEDFENWNV